MRCLLPPPVEGTTRPPFYLFFRCFGAEGILVSMVFCQPSYRFSPFCFFAQAAAPCPFPHHPPFGRSALDRGLPSRAQSLSHLHLLLVKTGFYSYYAVEVT